MLIICNKIISRSNQTIGAKDFKAVIFCFQYVRFHSSTRKWKEKKYQQLNELSKIE